MIVAGGAMLAKCLTAFAIGTILKQAGLSKSMSGRSERMFAEATPRRVVGIDNESNQVS